MKELYFKYGNHKTTDLCQVAYKYRRQGKTVIIMNADGNKRVKTHLQKENKPLLSVLPTHKITKNLFEDILNLIDDNDFFDTDVILIDNAHLLSYHQVTQLFYVCKILDIDVIAYGNRLLNGKSIPGAIRLLELADHIELISAVENTNLTFYYGVMDSGKTSQLLLDASSLENANQKIIVIKPATDRSLTDVKSRNGLSRKADIVLNANDSLKDVGYELARNHVNRILVDEAQFLTEKQINELYDISEYMHIPVDCYGLKTDFQTHAFPGSKRLLELADLKKLRAICSCKESVGANFNARKVKGKYVLDGEQVAVDAGTVSYDSLCSSCYLENVQKIPVKKLKNLIKKKNKKEILEILKEKIM